MHWEPVETLGPGSVEEQSNFTWLQFPFPAQCRQQAVTPVQMVSMKHVMKPRMGHHLFPFIGEGAVRIFTPDLIHQTRSNGIGF